MGGAVLAAPAFVRAQGRPVRVGAVSAGAPRTSPHWVAFTRRLAELGRAEGQNLVIEFRNADGRPDRFPELMNEMVRLGVDVLLPIGPESSLRAARDASPNLPIVVVAVDYDPIARGYVGSLARPGGIITGMFLRQPELTGKRIELLREMLPGIRRLALFWDRFSADQADEAETAAQKAGLQLLRTEFRQAPYAFDAPVRAAVRQPAVALLGLASPIFYRQRGDLAQAALRHRLPAVVPFRGVGRGGTSPTWREGSPHRP